MGKKMARDPYAVSVDQERIVLSPMTFRLYTIYDGQEKNQGIFEVCFSACFYHSSSIRLKVSLKILKSFTFLVTRIILLAMAIEAICVSRIGAGFPLGIRTLVMSALIFAAWLSYGIIGNEGCTYSFKKILSLSFL